MHNKYDGPMQAALLTDVNQPVTLQSVPDPVATPGLAVVRLSAAALNHRDLFIRLGQYANIRLPKVTARRAPGRTSR